MKSTIWVWFAVTLGLAGSAGRVHAYTINTTEAGKSIRWFEPAVRLRIDPALDASLPHGSAALEMGFEAWRGLPHVPDLMIESGIPEPTPGHHGAQPSNGVYLLREWPYDQRKLAVTVVTYALDSGKLLDADILVNGNVDFAVLDERVTDDTEHYDLAAVLTHEAGHVLGLGDSSSDPKATMFPSVMPGDTGKRTLSSDDEEGVIDSYMSSVSQPAGCQALSVLGRRRGSSFFVLVSFLIAASVGARAFRRIRRTAGTFASLSLFALLFGFGGSMAAPQLGRMAAVAEKNALSDLLVRSHRESRYVSDPAARMRIEALLGDGREVVLGRARRVATMAENGVLFTEYAVKSPDGSETRLRVPGGVRNGIGQRVLDAAPPPADDQDLAVVRQGNGTQRWAYASGGRVFGGHLGDGPAIGF